MDLARWVCFNLYQANPYIKPPKAQTPQSYIRFPWEKEEDPERLKEKAKKYRVTEAEAAELNRIMDEVFNTAETQENG